MISCIVRVVPLVRLPATHCHFDYAWSSPSIPILGQLVRIMFRRRPQFGIVVKLPSANDAHGRTLLTATAIHDAPLLSTIDLKFARAAADRFATAESEILRRMIPPVGPTTSQQLATLACGNAPAAQLPITRGSQFKWYDTELAAEKIIVALIKKILPSPIAIVAPTHERAVHICRLLKKYSPTHYTPTHIAARRTAWNKWRTGAPDTIIIGTHSSVWLPHNNDASIIIFDPTHPAHEQWDGPQYHNRAVLQLRIRSASENVYQIAHTPSSYDYSEYAKAPHLTHWPERSDVSDMPTYQRLHVLYELIAHEFNVSNSVCVLVPHLHAALRLFCADCHAVNDAPRDGTIPSCARCNGTRIRSYGLGGASIAAELKEKYGISSNVVSLHDQARHQNQNTPLIIMTAAAADYTSLENFNTIIDCATDFESQCAGADAEEQAIARLRRISVSFPSTWHGKWIAITALPSRLLWSAQSGIGLSAWWSCEEPLRKKFKQPPFEHS